MRVTIETRVVGQMFGTRGVVVDARSGKVIESAEPTRPLGDTAAAMRDAERIVAARGAREGWILVSERDR